MNKIVLGFSQRSKWAIFTLVQRLIPILVFALVAGACASDSSQSAPDAAGVATTVASETGDTTSPSNTTDAESSSATTAPPVDGAPATTAPAATATDFDGAAAPDFRLALADGSDFVLSAEAKPVYMIFWAEW